MNQASPKIEQSIDTLIQRSGTPRAVLDQLTLGEAEELIGRLIEMLARNADHDLEEAATELADQRSIGFEEEATQLRRRVDGNSDRLTSIDSRTWHAEKAIANLAERVEIVETHVRGMADVRSQIDRDLTTRIASLEANNGTAERMG